MHEVIEGQFQYMTKDWLNIEVLVGLITLTTIAKIWFTSETIRAIKSPKSPEKNGLSWSLVDSLPLS